MDLFKELHKLYLDTIDPEFKYKDLVNIKVLFSIVLHIVLYLFALFWISHIFKLNFNKETYERAMKFLFILMIIGYPLRLHRSKTLYQLFVERGYDSNKAKHITKKLMHGAYYTFYFFA